MNLEAPAVYRKLRPVANDNLRAAQTLYLSTGVAAAAQPGPENAALQEEARRLLKSVRRTDMWLRRLLSNSSQIAALDKAFIPQVFEIARKGLRAQSSGPQVLPHPGQLSEKECRTLLKFCLFFLPDLRSATALTANSADQPGLNAKESK